MSLKRVLLIASLIWLTACQKRAQVKVPVLLARKCPANSVEVNGVHYCSDPPKCQQTTPVGDGEICMAIDPETKQPLGVFFKGDSCNPFTEPDCDAPDKGKNKDGRDKDDKD